MKRRLFAVLAMAFAAAIVALASTAGDAFGESPEGYLHNLATPPFCALPWEAPDPSLDVCQATSFAPRLALTSQSVLLRGGDYEATHEECAAYAATVETTFTLDGELLPVVTQPCRYVPLLVENARFLAIPNWDYEVRALLPAGSLAVGAHTLTWTAIFSADFSYTLGCQDPSGTCTFPAGTVLTSTMELTITA